MTVRALPLVLLAAVVACLGLVGSGALAAPPTPIASCSPGPSDCGAWHTSNVTVSWSTKCGPTTVTEDTAGTPVSCSTSDGTTTITTTVVVRKDSTPPSVRGTPTRGPDSNGWYNGPLDITFEGTDALSGVDSCAPAKYSGPDSATARATGTCTDRAGNTGTGTLELKYDATPPTAEAKADRKPDANGWYNRPLTVSFAAADPVSGVDSCAAPIAYKGPDTPKTSFSGTCRDKAGNTSPPAAFELKYDSAPPKLGRVRVEVERKGVVLRWSGSKDTVSYSVVRRPGLRGKKPSTIYSGAARTFVDKRLTNGLRYSYTVTAYDAAGNGDSTAIRARPTSVATTARSTPASKPARSTPALRRPVAGARLSAPPLLTWSAVPKATYYNVQLWRDGVKILSTWTKHPKFRVEKSWTYEGRKYALTPAVYTWFVWPGYLRPSENRYGKLIGSRTFVVTRR
jgi:hypothetical protein